VSLLPLISSKLSRRYYVRSKWTDRRNSVQYPPSSSISLCHYSCVSRLLAPTFLFDINWHAFVVGTSFLDCSLLWISKRFFTFGLSIAAINNVYVSRLCTYNWLQTKRSDCLINRRHSWREPSTKACKMWCVISICCIASSARGQPIVLANSVSLRMFKKEKQRKKGRRRRKEKTCLVYCSRIARTRG